MPPCKPPIFIVGAPRSGTSLLRNILDRHPALAICDETHFYRYVYMRRRAFGDLGDLKNRQRLVNEYLSLPRMRRLSKDVSSLAAKLLREGHSYPAFFACLLKHYAESNGKKRWGEKTPHHAFFTETLCEWYPGATIIHLLRDPRDVVASLVHQTWAPDSAVTNARTWVKRNLAASRSSHRPEYLLVRYETLVDQPERELARICAHLGEDYVPSMLAPDKQTTPLSSGLKFADRPVTKERLGAWHKELTAEQVALVEWIAGRHMQEFGYQFAAGPPSRWAMAHGLALASLDAVRRLLTQFPGVWYHFMQPTKLAKEEFWMLGRLRDRERGSSHRNLGRTEPT